MRISRVMQSLGVFALLAGAFAIPIPAHAQSGPAKPTAVQDMPAEEKAILANRTPEEVAQYMQLRPLAQAYIKMSDAAADKFVAALPETQGTALLSMIGDPRNVVVTVEQVAVTPTPQQTVGASDTSGTLRAAARPAAKVGKNDRLNLPVLAKSLIGCASRSPQYVGRVANTVVYRLTVTVNWCYSGGKNTSFNRYDMVPSDLGANWRYEQWRRNCSYTDYLYSCDSIGKFWLSAGGAYQEHYPRIQQYMRPDNVYSERLTCC